MIIIEDKPLDPGHIVHSFKRSNTRRMIYLHLCSVYPRGESIEEISAATGYSKWDILGVLMCYGNRYKPEDSLVALGLARVKEEEYHGRKVMVFRTASNGKDIEILLHSYARYNVLFTNLRKHAKKIERKK